MGDSSKDLLRAEDAAKLWGVTETTVYAWIRERRLSCFQRGADGVLVASRGDIRAARVMRPHELRGKGIDDALLDRALRKRIVASPDGRYSLGDLDAILAFGAAARFGPPKLDGPVRHQSGFTSKPFAWNEELQRAFVLSGAHPPELPEGYFEVPGEPRLITPANVFLYTLHGPVPNRPTARYVRRSAGYEVRDGELRWYEEDDRFAILEEGETMEPEWVASNQAFRHAEVRMQHETYVRRRRRRRGAS
jgi:hypothetical protein